MINRIFLSLEEEEITPAPIAIAPQTESDKARIWFRSVDLENMQIEDVTNAEFYKHDVSVYRGKFCFYLTTRSPQQKTWQRSLGTAWARGDAESVRAGMDRFIATMESKTAKRNAKTEAKREARTAFVNPYKVGDIFNSSWGYDQTNKEFYQVVKISGLTMTIREVSQNREQTGFMCGNCSPVKGDFIGLEKKVVIQVDESGYHWINSPIHGHLFLWDGKPEYFSSYA